MDSEDEVADGLVYTVDAFEIRCGHEDCDGRALNGGSNIWFEDELAKRHGEKVPCDECGRLIRVTRF